jgi:membrane protease YdiL (CAAX protease family)
MSVPRLISLLRTLGICLGLFAATYAPTFAIVHLLRQPLHAAVPLIIAISLLIALSLILALRAWAGYHWPEFGFRLASSKYIIWTFGVGLPIAIGVTWLDHLFGAAGPLAGLSLPLWKSVLYFVLCAPLQEEVIFRGLIQTAVARSAPGDVALPGIRVSGAALIVAILFALIHLEVAVFTALAAFILGLLAGELRRRSGSLIPAIFIHLMFNAASFFWIAAR